MLFDWEKSKITSTSVFAGGCASLEADADYLIGVEGGTWRL